MSLDDLRKYAERIHGELIALRRMVVESQRDFGILSEVKTLAEFRKHWPELKTTVEGREIIGAWILRAVTHRWITVEEFDKIWDATMGAIDERS